MKKEWENDYFYFNQENEKTYIQPKFKLIEVGDGWSKYEFENGEKFIIGHHKRNPSEEYSNYKNHNTPFPKIFD